MSRSGQSGDNRSRRPKRAMGQRWPGSHDHGARKRTVLTSNGHPTDLGESHGLTHDAGFATRQGPDTFLQPGHRGQPDCASVTLGVPWPPATEGSLDERYASPTGIMRQEIPIRFVGSSRSLRQHPRQFLIERDGG